MTNAILLALSNQKRIESITVHSIPAEHSYKIVRFKQVFKKLMSAYTEAREAILQEVGIEDEKAFNFKVDDLKRRSKSLNDEESATLKDLLEKKAKLSNMLTRLLNEKVVFENVKTIPYEIWKAMQDENKTESEDRLAGEILVIREVMPDGSIEFEHVDVELELEGVIWEAPNDEK